MNLLGIDTATEACTVALQQGGECIERVLPQRQHAEKIIELVDSVLSEANLDLADMDALVWGRGPGMFTGLRIGAGVVQGLAYAIDRPVVCVSSLAVLAQAQSAEHVIAAIDARMDQVYWAVYQRINDRVEIIGDERVDHPDTIHVDSAGPFVGTGSGWDQYHASLSAALNGKLEGWQANQAPQGKALMELGVAGFNAGEAVAAAQALPVYVRDSVAQKQSGKTSER